MRKLIFISMFLLLLPRLAWAETDSAKVRSLLNTVATIYRSKADTCLGLCKEAIKIIELSPNKDKKSFVDLKLEALEDLATINQEHGNISEAIPYYNEALHIYESRGDQENIANSLYGLGTVYSGIGNIQKAIEFHSRSMTIYEKQKDTHGVALAYYSLGRIYGEQGDTSKREEYFTKALKIYETNNDQWGIALLKSSFGTMYLKKGDYKNAIDCFSRCLEVYNGSAMPDGTKGDKWGIANSLELLGKVYDKKKEFSTALDYYLKALKLRTETNYKLGMALSDIEIGKVYQALGNNKLAEEYGTKALAEGKEIGHPQNISEAAQLLRLVYHDKNDFKQAYEMLELYMTMNDSVKNEKNRKAVYKQQVNYEFEKKEAESKVDQEKKDVSAKQEKELREYKQFWVEVISTVIILSLLTIALIIFRRYKMKKRSSEELAVKNSIIENKQKEILDSIHYAKRIQQSLLPTERYIERNLKRLNRR